MLLYTVGIDRPSIVSKQSIIHHHDTTTISNDSVFPLDQSMLMCSMYVCLYVCMYVCTYVCVCTSDATIIVIYDIL